MPWSSSATRTRMGATCSRGPIWPPAPRPWAWSPRETSSGTRPGLGYGRTAIRTPSSRTSSTSTSSCCATMLPVVPAAAARLEVGVEDVAVDARLAHRPGLGGDRHRRDGAVARGSIVFVDVAERHLVQPALLAVGAQDEPVGAVLLEELDLVALIEIADLRPRAARRASRGDGRRGSGSPSAPGRRADRRVRGRTSGAVRARCRGSGRPCVPGGATAAASGAGALRSPPCRERLPKLPRYRRWSRLRRPRPG